MARTLKGGGGIAIMPKTMLGVALIDRSKRWVDVEVIALTRSNRSPPRGSLHHHRKGVANVE